MAAIDFSQPLLGAGASAETDFASAQARASINFLGNAQFKRGIKAELGIESFADASAGISKFIKASIEGTALARAKVGVQLQLPLNLFNEFGFAARAEAIAEAAVGIKANLGLSLGDFILLAKRDPNLVGLPLELLIIFLEEVELGGELRINVSASAKAHASVSISGKIIAENGKKAGFFFTIDAGAGLKVGVGKGLSVGAGFKDFRRFYGRAVDKSVDATIHGIMLSLPENLNHLKPFLGCFAPIAKISLRSSYDIGKHIIDTIPDNSALNAETLCNQAVKVVLEEVQRFAADKFLELALKSFTEIIDTEKAALGQAWDDALQERILFADALMKMPEESFQPTAENIDYWKDFTARGLALISKLYGAAGNPNPLLVEAICIIYCCTELLLEATKSKINKASAYAGIIAVGRVQADTQPFKGPLSHQPPALLKTSINTVIGRNINSNLEYPHLLEYLVDDLLINKLLNQIPEVKEFLIVFKQEFNLVEKEILKIFLQNAGAFIDNGAGAGEMDAKKSLDLIVRSLNKFLTDKFKAEVLPQVLAHIDDPTLKLYVEEVLYSTVVYTKDVTLNSLLNWENKTFTNDDFTEALAGIMMMLLGRTVVIVGDTLITAGQQEIQKSCNELADNIQNNDPSIQPVKQLFTDPDLLRLVVDGIRIGGEVLGPLPYDSRTRVRSLLYQVFETLPVGSQQTFLQQLGDQFFIPNLQQLESLTYELADIAKTRFGLFAEKFILRVGDYILQELTDLIQHTVNMVLQWEQDLLHSIAALSQLLQNLDQQIIRLNNELISMFQTATSHLHAFFQKLESPALRSSVKTAVKEKFVNVALSELGKNEVYKLLPVQFKSAVRNLATGTVDNVMDSAVVAPVFNIINSIAFEMDELLPDIRSLKGDQNLAEQILNLVLNKVEQRIKSHFGGIKPSINVNFSFSYTIPFVGTKYVFFSLGKIEINLNVFLNVIRTTIKTVDFYHTQLNNAAIAIANALGKELELATAKNNKAGLEQEKLVLENIHSEHNTAPKEIAILSPVSLCHYTSAVDVKVHFAGISMSYLGLNANEAQRVFIYLNGALIPPKSLVAEESTGIIDPVKHDKDINYNELFSNNNGLIKNNKVSISSTSFNSKGSQNNSKSSNQVKNNMLSTSPYVINQQPESKLKSIGADLQLSSNQSKDDYLDTPVINYNYKNLQQGNIIDYKETQKIINTMAGGITIQFLVERDQLSEGVNVLTAVLIEKGGARHQQNVSFTVSNEPKNIKPIPGTIQVLDDNNKLKDMTITFDNVINGKSKTKEQLKPAPIVKVHGTIKDKKLVTLNDNKVELVETDINVETEVNTLLPATTREIANKKKKAFEYLKHQDNLNFKRFKKEMELIYQQKEIALTSQLRES